MNVGMDETFRPLPTVHCLVWPVRWWPVRACEASEGCQSVLHD